MVSICPLLWQRDVKLQQTLSVWTHHPVTVSDRQWNGCCRQRAMFLATCWEFRPHHAHKAFTVTQTPEAVYNLHQDWYRCYRGICQKNNRTTFDFGFWKKTARLGHTITDIHHLIEHEQQMHLATIIAWMFHIMFPGSCFTYTSMAGNICGVAHGLI